MPIRVLGTECGKDEGTRTSGGLITCPMGWEGSGGGPEQELLSFNLIEFNLIL